MRPIIYPTAPVEQEMTAVAADRFSDALGWRLERTEGFRMTGLWLLLAVVAVLAIIAMAVLSCKVLREYERGVVCRLGRVRPLCGDLA